MDSIMIATLPQKLEDMFNLALQMPIIAAVKGQIQVFITIIDNRSGTF